MELIVTGLTFVTIFFIIIEIIFSLSIIITLSNFKKIFRSSQEHISEINFHRSTGKGQPISKLDFLTKDHFRWIPDLFKNHLAYVLKDKIIHYIREEGISCRDRTNLMAQNVLQKESWLFNYKYEDLVDINNFLRVLYIPLGSICALIVFIIGYSSIGEQFTHNSFENITNNIHIISLTMKMSSITFIIGLCAHIISNTANFYIKNRNIESELSETIFQLKASSLNIKID